MRQMSIYSRNVLQSDGIDSATYVSAYDQFAVTNNVLYIRSNESLHHVTDVVLCCSLHICRWQLLSQVLYHIVLYCISVELHKCILDAHIHSHSQSVTLMTCLPLSTPWFWSLAPPSDLGAHSSQQGRVLSGTAV